MFFSVFFSFLFFSSCDLIEYHPYDVRIKRKGLNKKYIEQVELSCKGKESIRFVWTGDVQRTYDELAAFVKDVNAREGIDFILNGGDISDFGLNREFDWVEDILDGLRAPHISLVGNHDLLGNGNEVFKAMYGDFNVSFVAGITKIICVNTNALESDYSEPVPDYAFMRAELQDTLARDYHQTIVTMHAPPFGEQFDNNTAQFFQYFVRSYKNILFCAHAHTHVYSINDYFNDGILYYGCDSMKKRSYLVFTVGRNEYTHERVFF